PITTVVAALRLTAAAKGKQPARATSLNDPSEVERTEAKQLKIVLRRSKQETHVSQHGGSSTDEGTDVDDQDKGRDDNEGEKNDESDADDDDRDDAEKDDDDDEEEIAKLDEQEDTESGEGDVEETESDKESADEETREKEEENFDPIPRTPKDSEDDGNGEEDQGLRVSEEQRLIKEEEADELYRDVDINQGRGLQVSQDIEDSHVTLTPVKPDGVESIFTTASSPIAPLQTSTPIMTPSTIDTITTSSDAPIPPTTIPSVVLQNLLTFDSVFRFEERVKSLEVNFSEFMQTNQFTEAVSNISGIVHQYMTQQMTEAVREAVQIQTDRLQDSFQRENDEFLRTIDENMKKIIKGQMEGNKSIQRSNEQRNLYKALVDVYEADKTILESYGDTAILKRRRGDDDDKEGPSAGSDRGSTIGTQSRQMSASESAFVEEPVQTTCQMEEPPHLVFETAKQADSRSSLNELLDTPIDFSNFIMNRLCVDTLNPVLLAGPTYELMRGSCTSLTELEYHLEEVYKRQWINWTGSILKRRIMAVTDLKIMELHNYKHLDWISVHRDDDKIYKFKEGDFKRLRLQDIEDILLLLVQGKLSNLTVEERFSFNVSLRLFTRSIVIQWRMEDLQLGVESYQKRLNLTKPDTDGTLNDVRNALDDRLKGIRMQYLPQTIRRKAWNGLLEDDCMRETSGCYKGPYESSYTAPIFTERREAYTAYSNPRGFIYQNKDKKNRLIRINELHKFNDGTLNDVRNALDDRLKGIRMQYLPQTIWRKGDKDRASAMIQSIDKMLKTRRIMRSLERFVGGRLCERDFRMLQRTI
nr:hypothetical protein [Tanacetum cinerariifolium]